MKNFNNNKIPTINNQKSFSPEISIVLPCRNEEQAITYCLNQISTTLILNEIKAEILISDSSSDSTSLKVMRFAQENPNKLKIKFIKHNKIGYGNAYINGFKHVSTNYIFMADCDGTYDFSEIPNFLNELKNGYDFIIGNRFAYNFEKEVMPLSHRYIGNPFLSGLLRLLFKTKIKDAHCGMRAIKTESLKKLNLKTTGMEFASEMIIKAIRYQLLIKQLPIYYHKRIGKSKLNPIADGWRHIKYMLHSFFLTKYEI